MSNDLKQLQEYVKQTRRNELSCLQSLLNDIRDGVIKQNDLDLAHLSEQLYISNLHLLDNILDKIDDIEYGEHSGTKKQ